MAQLNGKDLHIRKMPNADLGKMLLEALKADGNIRLQLSRDEYIQLTFDFETDSIGRPLWKLVLGEALEGRSTPPAVSEINFNPVTLEFRAF